MNRFKTIFYCLILGAIYFSPALFAFDNNDIQLWLAVKKAWTVNIDSGLVFEEEFRFGNRIVDIYRLSTDFGFFRKFFPWLHLGAHYRLFWERSGGGNPWLTENRPFGYVTFTLSWRRFEVSEKNTFEYRIRSGKEDILMYRSMVTVSYRLSSPDINLYISDEIYLDLTDPSYDRNRVYMGISKPVSDTIRMEISYIFQKKRGIAWNIFRIRLSF